MRHKHKGYHVPTISLIIPAAGLGTRFHQSSGAAFSKSRRRDSKLFYDLAGEPVLARTLAAFAEIPEIREVVLAVSPGMRSEIKRVLGRVAFPKIRYVTGAETRAGSVLSALRRTSPSSEWVMVHDGARPLVTTAAIRQLIRGSVGWDGVILARKVIPTIKRVLRSDGRIESTVDRSTLYEAETPQMVRRSVLIKAYKMNPCALQATDEAGLLESIGARVRVISHDGWNPKITTVTDLFLAESMIQNSNPTCTRTGIGFDTHRLVPGRKLWLGGIAIPSPKGSLGHSDGDALLHAIADAMLGVIGRGDIGEWFPDKDPRWKDVKSGVIVEKVLAESKKAGWLPYHVDSNIILETPKLGPYKMKIRRRIARLLQLPVEDVSVKARTREGLGAEGEGLAITCQAVVSMKRIQIAEGDIRKRRS